MENFVEFLEDVSGDGLLNRDREFSDCDLVVA